MTPIVAAIIQVAHPDRQFGRKDEFFRKVDANARHRAKIATDSQINFLIPNPLLQERVSLPSPPRRGVGGEVNLRKSFVARPYHLYPTVIVVIKHKINLTI